MNNPKIPPHSEEAEKSVLGAVLLDRDAIVKIAEFLRPEHFYYEANRHIFEAALGLYEQRAPLDVVTVSENLKKRKRLTASGGSDYLAELVEGVPTAANIVHYAHLVKDCWSRRELIRLSGEVSEMAFDGGGETAMILDQAEQKIFALSQEQQRQDFVSVRDALAESFDRLDEIQRAGSGLRGIATGYKDLDNALAGLQRSNLVVLAARPGMGKTTLALNIAQFATVASHISVGYFALEMSQEEMVDRMLVAQADIDAWKFKIGKFKDDDFNRLSEAMGVLADAPFFIDDTPALSIMEMRTKARRLKAEHDVQLLVVDYLQLARSRNLENRVQEVSEISQGLKNLARELKIPVLALSQLSRAVEHRGTKRPQLADLRESGAIEQDADVVMFLYRENDEDEGNFVLDIQKHRNGPLRRINLFFKGDRIRFFGVDRHMGDQTLASTSSKHSSTKKQTATVVSTTGSSAE